MIVTNYQVLMGWTDLRSVRPTLQSFLMLIAKVYKIMEVIRTHSIYLRPDFRSQAPRVRNGFAMNNNGFAVYCHLQRIEAASIDRGS